MSCLHHWPRGVGPLADSTTMGFGRRLSSLACPGWGTPVLQALQADWGLALPHSAKGFLFAKLLSALPVCKAPPGAASFRLWVEEAGGYDSPLSRAFEITPGRACRTQGTVHWLSGCSILSWLGEGSGDGLRVQG